MKKRIASTLLILSLLGKGLSLNAYDPVTHREIAHQSAQPSVSSVDQILKGQLDLSAGIGERFQGLSQPGLRTVEQLLGDGALFEDVFPRFFNHFHNPLRPWDNAGLQTFSILGVPLIRGQSSVLWQQNTSQDTTFVFTPLPFLSGGGNWSWQDARRHYLNALTRSRKEDQGNQPGRDTAFAETFEALGRLTHLIQDTSVPAHVRNDPHLISDGFEDWAEQEQNRPLVRTLLAGPPKKPDQLIFSLGVPIPDLNAKVPVARLFDTDQYTSGNPDITRTPIVINPDGTQTAGQPRIGLAEYTNANFFSDDTVFKDFPFPAQTSVDLHTEVETELTTGEPRRYFKKARDGDVVEHIAVPSQLHKFLPDALKDKKIGLDDRVFEDYAEKLLPRAVGYSASLLDYFFRGKLDVDLVQDPNSIDPTVVKLSGTNGSPDKLDGGTLTLYADDPITGERTLVPALEPNFSVVANKGEPVESAKFQINAESERFMAVYKGKLGNEAPQGDFPGGVIGKVLGGVRAESIFPEGDKRMLRTVDGVFSLPPTTDRLQLIQWGDPDNTFVGTLSNSANPNSPDQVLAFKINRPLGSGEVPLVPAPDGPQVVSADPLKAVSFPFGLSLGVTVDYSQTIRFQQLLFMYDRIETNVWNGSFYSEFLEIRGPTQAEVILDQTFPFAQKFPVVLDRAHLCSSGCFTFGNFVLFAGPPVKPYVWKVEQVGLDAQGRLLALVRVMLTSPEDNVRKFNLRTRGGFDCQVKENPSQSADAVGRFQVAGLLRALIDVEKGEVLGVTSSSTFSPSSQIADVRFKLQQHLKRTFVGGPLAGTSEELCADPALIFPRSDFTTVDTASMRLPTAGVLSQSLSGWFGPDIESLVSPPSDTVTEEFDFSLVYFVDSATATNRAVRLTVTNSFTSGFLDLDGARIVHSTTSASPEPILFFTREEHGSFNEQGLLVRWSPQSPSNTALAFPEKLPPAGFYRLQFATSEAALLDFDDLEGESSTMLVDFAGQTLQSFTGQTLSDDYVLLKPKFLYNINDTRFHTPDPTLRLTVLPRRLAVALAIRPPKAAYHLIQLR